MCVCVCVCACVCACVPALTYPGLQWKNAEFQPALPKTTEQLTRRDLLLSDFRVNPRSARGRAVVEPIAPDCPSPAVFDPIADVLVYTFQ